MTNILIVTSVDAEKTAAEAGLKGDSRFHVISGGVGIAAASASTATALAARSYNLVINMGIGGGFIGRAAVGDLVIATKSAAADLGAESEGGFISIDELGFGSAVIECDEKAGDSLWQECNHRFLPVHKGSVLTLSTVTGTADTADRLLGLYPDAFCEAMEGFGVATAAKQAGRPYLEVRSISNPVGPRDRGAWQIKEALARLTEASRLMKEVL
ncbi:futalosine hydrolase [Alteribacter keqinensis]|uniref:Futalosine hydrolase n=1 Tax=Alteribacter keqinensis TaxID=2483800 RepID=A0A3M7TMH7_9BACI|nr:futalosine hydrolase [Alteribacter keqinensis]RNA66282.1 futalosine hydrolase [Alteribacter keqinensis]